MNNETKEGFIAVLYNLSNYLHEIFIEYKIVSASNASLFTYQVYIELQSNSLTSPQLYLRFKAIFELIYRVKDENENIKQTEFWRSVVKLKKLFLENNEVSFLTILGHLEMIISSHVNLSKRVEKVKNFVQIGRSDRKEHGNDIIFKKDRTLSRIHLVITVDEGDFYIEDRSANGTFVNGKKIEKGIKLPVKIDDEIRIGREETLIDLNEQKIQDLLNI